MGCTSTNSDRAFTDVRQTIAERSGNELHWRRDSSPAGEIPATINSLLRTNLTPESAVTLALLNSPHIQATLEELGIAQAELVEAGLLSNPRFSGSWRFPEGGGAVNSEYSLTHEFLQLIMLPLRKKVAKRNYEGAKLRVAHDVLEFVGEVRRAFYETQAQAQILKRLRTIAEVNEAAADLAQRQHEAGNITDLELANHKAVYAQSRVFVADAEKELRSQREEVNRLLGLWGPQTAWKLHDELPPVPEKELSLENVESLAVRQRLDLAATREQLNNMALAYSLRAKTRFVPVSVEAGVSAEREVEGEWVTGPTLEIELPIFDQGQAALGRLGAQYRQARNEYQSAAINIRSEVREARDKLLATRDLAEYYGKVLLPLRIQIVNQTLLQYNAMQAGAYDLLAAKERELDTEREYVNAWRDYWLARAELERAVGGRLSAPATQPHSHEHHDH